MNELQIFNSSEFGQIRTVTIDNEPYFVGNDVATILGYAEPRSTVSKKVDAEDRGVAKLETPSGIQEMTVINESGLYSLILGSKLESAKRFKRWVTSEVLPSIRKRGSYQMPTTTTGQIQLLAQGHVELEQKIAEVSKDLQDFKQDLPLLAVECEKITRAVKAKGVEVLGGTNSEAYLDKSLRGKVYSDIHNEVKRQFGVNTYKAIKRSECDKAVEIVSMYQLPMALAEEIADCNEQMGF